MNDKNQRILFLEMILDLHYRLRFADAIFCNAAEDFVSASALEDWEGRSRTLRDIREYSQTLQIINVDFGRIVDRKKAVFPEELGEWIYDSLDGDLKVQKHLERLHFIAEGLEMAVNSELLHLESVHE